MVVCEVEFPVFRSRVGLMRKKYPDRPVRYFSDENRYVLYWVDDDGLLLRSELLKSSFRSREEEEQFKNDFLRVGTPLLKDVINSVEPSPPGEGEDLEKEFDLLDPDPELE